MEKIGNYYQSSILHRHSQRGRNISPEETAMPNIIPITDFSAPELDVYAQKRPLLTDGKSIPFNGKVFLDFAEIKTR